MNNVDGGRAGSESVRDWFQQRRDRWFARPAQRQGCQCHTKLSCRDQERWVVEQSQSCLRSAALALRTLFELRVSHGDKSKFRGHEEGVCNDERGDSQELQKHTSSRHRSREKKAAGL